MNDLHEYVRSRPLFDTHEHQEGFSIVERKKAALDYRSLCGFLPDDMRSSGLENPGDADEGRFWEAWESVRTTGYGKAAELSSGTLLGMEFKRENAEAITAGLRKLTADRTGREIYETVFSRAGIRWVICDEWWTRPTDLMFFTGREHPDFFGHALRCDKVIAMAHRDTIVELEGILDRSIQRLDQLDRAMDEYAEKARAGGKLAAMKSALAYLGALRFECSSFADAERVFERIMQGAAVDARPLTGYLFHHFVQRAQDFAMPVQIHVGALSHNGIDPVQGDPAGLIPVFQRYPRVRFDLFHAGWPFCDLMAAIGKSFPNVYLDMCWAWAVNPVAMERILDEWLSAVPNNKILGFGGDTGAPYAAVGYAAQARIGIANTLERKVARGEYDLRTARLVADRILFGNARALYPHVGETA